MVTDTALKCLKIVADDQEAGNEFHMSEAWEKKKTVWIELTITASNFKSKIISHLLI